MISPRRETQAIDSGIEDDLASRTYEPLGFCMYCGSHEDLSDEHVLPYGLSGPAILPKSSCERCRRITGRLEGQILRGPMRALRVQRGLKSRSRHESAPETYPLTVLRDGVEEHVDVPAEEYPVMMVFPMYGLPAFLKPEGFEEGIRVRGLVTYSFGRHPDEVKERLQIDDFRLTQTYKMSEFGRMIGKIGYAFAVAEGFVTLDDGPLPVAASIIGETAELGRYVGTLQDPLNRVQGQLHRLGLHEDHARGLKYASVKLFADAETPQYGVILDDGG